MTTADVPTVTENAPIVREKSVHTLDDLRRRRDSDVAFMLAKLTLRSTSAPTSTSVLPAQGWTHRYARLQAGPSRLGDLVTMIIEVSGQELKEKAAKVATARTLWCRR